MTPGSRPGGLVTTRPPRSPVLAALRLALLIVACCAPAPTALADDVQLWPTFTVYTPTVQGWRGSAEIHARWTDDLETYNRTVLRLNGGKLVTRRLELFGGWEMTDPAAAGVRREQRLWEQAEYVVRPGRWTFSNRVRLEQRFVSGAPEMASRLRYRFRVQHPLGTTGWTLGASEELWLHMNTVATAGRRGIDQNRVALTATRAVTPRLTIEPGYLYIDVNLRPPLRNRGSHVATLQVTARM